MGKRLFAAAIAASALSYASAAQAILAVPSSTAQFVLTGAGITASGSLSYAPDTIPGDPVGANNIVAVTGLFSDANVGVSNVAITGLIPTSPTPKPPGADGFIFATSLSYLPVLDPLGVLPAADEVAPGEGVLSYSNLFYPLGAPDTCDDGITGGYLDVFGMMLTLANGDVAELWSNGGGPNDSDIYGAAVASDGAYTAIDYIAGGVTMSVPEPDTMALLAAGLVLTGLARPRRRT
jgi:hypothetical protein